MAGKHASPARPSASSRVGGTTRASAPRHSAGVRTFAGTPLTVDGVTRDAMSASALLGSSIPKGLLAATLGANHAGAAYDLTTSESSAQQAIGTAIAGVDAVSKARAIRAVSRNAEGIAPTSTPLSIEGARLLAAGRGPRVSVEGMVAGDIARAVAMFDRYGYTVNRAMVPPRLDPMTHRSYWQLADATILGAAPQADRDAIASAFERGVTVWNVVSEIGTRPANAPRAGVSY